MKMNKIDPFSPQIDLWMERDPNEEECNEMIQHGTWKPFIRIKIKKEKTINNPFEAALFLLENQSEARLDRHVIRYLDRSKEYLNWLSFMPKSLPKELIDYQCSYPPEDLNAVDHMVNQYGVVIPNGQTLFHGGLWPRDKDGSCYPSFETDRVLSTSFCPKVALSNGMWKGKAWNDGRLDLMLIEVGSSKTKAFIYDKDTSEHGNEMEVLFGKGATLNFISETKSRTSLLSYKYDNKPKEISSSVIRAELI